MLKALYDSPLHIPVAAWVACGIAVAVALARRKLVAFTVFFAVVCALDAWLTGPWTPLAPDTAAATAAGVTFVIAGDFRWFVLLARAAQKKVTARGLAVALALAFVVPVLAQIARALGLSDMRKIFLCYELLFFGLAVVVRFVAIPRIADAFATKMTHFEIVQYGLWAIADVVLLATNADAGYLLRMVPNLMYYAFFLIVAAQGAEE